MIVLSGNIIELGGGSYRANLFDWDCSGDQCGYLFTASGCVPVQYQFDMTDGISSGRLYLSSGQNTSLSGIFGTASLNSGQSVLVYSGQLSGQQVNLLSGNTIAVLSGTNVNLFSGQLSGRIVDAHVTRWKDFSPVVTPNVSGVPVVDQWYASGQSLYGYDFILDSGSATTVTLPASGVDGSSMSGVNQYEFMCYEVVGGTGKNQIILTTSGTGTNRQYNVLSGTMIVPCDNTSQLVFRHKWQPLSGVPVVASLLSGQQVSLYSGSFSGQPAGTATIASGQVWLSSGQAVSLNSGQFVLVYSGQLSGQQVTAASGVFGTASLNSGQSVLVYSGQLSGQKVNLLSGNAVEVLSGTNVNLFSGTSVLVYSGQLSGQKVNLLSGNVVEVHSGTKVNVFSGQLSGFVTAQVSGTTYVASGTVATSIASGTVYPYSGFIRDILTADFTQFSGVLASGLSGRCVVTGVRKLTNKWDLTSSSGYLTSYMEDDTTVSMQQALTAVSGAAAVTGLDTK